MLSSQEKSAFKSWLNSVVERSGLGPTAFANELGDQSTSRVTRYLKEGRIPTRQILYRIAGLCQVKYAEACIKAGYFDDVIAAIDVYNARAEKTGKLVFRRAAFVLAFVVFPIGRPASARHWQECVDLADEVLATQIATGSSNGIKIRRGSAALSAAVHILGDKRLDAVLRRRVVSLILSDWALHTDARTARSLYSELYPGQSFEALRVH
jgi:hypothetical protein